LEVLTERIRLRASMLKEDGVLTQGDLEGAGILPVPGNANPFVPWTDPNLPYECFCGEFIYADTPHSHDEPFGGEMSIAGHVAPEPSGLTEAAKKFLDRIGDLEQLGTPEEIAEQAFAIWGESQLAYYDTTNWDRDDQAFYRSRPMTEPDAVMQAVLRRANMASDPIYMANQPVSIWPEAETLVRQKIDASYDYDAEIRSRDQLAREDYRRFGDHA
jgi:hypothetical protein